MRRESLKNFRKKKMRILNSLIVPKILKKRTLWDFSTFVLLQNIKKNERRTLWGHLKNLSHSLIAEKSEKRDPLGFFNIRSVARYQTKRRVDPL